MRRTSYLVNNFAILMLLLASACNMPGRASRGTPTPDVTQAYQTVEARLTEAASKTPAASPTSDPTCNDCTSSDHRPHLSSEALRPGGRGLANRRHHP